MFCLHHFNCIKPVTHSLCYSYTSCFLFFFWTFQVDLVAIFNICARYLPNYSPFIRFTVVSSSPIESYIVIMLIRQTKKCGYWQ